MLTRSQKIERIALLEEASRRKQIAALQAHRDEILRDCQSLAAFARRAWRLLEPKAEIVWNWHLDVMCRKLEAVTRGEITRLLLNVPPGSMKSLLVSVIWPAWEWGPMGMSWLRYISTAYGEGPVKRDARKTRDLILSDWYQTLWPEVKLTRSGEMSFANSNTGTREGFAFGSLTSQRGDRLILDDPHSTETAESPAERETTTRKFREGALNRLNDEQRSAIIVIMQRLHAKDISGVILELDIGFEHVCLPMEFDPNHPYRSPEDIRTQPGELLNPIRFPPEAIEKLKRGMGAYAWAGQYQQTPGPREGGMFKRSWFEIVAAVPAGGRVVRCWDLAASEPEPGRDPDWTSGLRMRRPPDGMFYVEHVEHLRAGPAEIERTVKNTASTDGPDTAIGIPQDPGQAGKSQVAYMIRELAGYVVKALPQSGSKETRAGPAAAQAEAGNIKLLAGPWNEAFLDDVCGFPTAPHDDIFDSLANAFTMLIGNGLQGWIEHYEELGAAARGQGPAAALVTDPFADYDDG